MKKSLVLIFILIAYVASLKGQSVNVQSAITYLRNGKLEKARKAIDEAILDSKTSTWPKTWYYRGSIYYSIKFSADEKIRNLDTNALEKAYESFNKALTLDTEKEFFNDFAQQIVALYSEYYYSKGAENFKLASKTNDKKLFEKALHNFKYTLKISSMLNQVDSITMLNAAISAERCEKSDTAIYFYEKLVKLQPKNMSYYVSLMRNYRKINQTDKALETAERGLKVSPDNLKLILEQTDIYLASGETEKAQQNLMKAIEKDPNNHILYFAIGSNFEKIYNDSTKTIQERMTAYENAEKYYQKAIDLKPDYADANYNIGALHFNEAVRVLENADKIQDEKKYNIEKENADKLFEKALPYLEKAEQITPNDYGILISLKQIYARTKRYDKAKEINVKLESIKK